MKKNDFFSLPETQQRMVLEQAAIRHNLAKQAVEKDLWIWLLTAQSSILMEN